ncbi:hypothetical protein GOZ83_12435 [Agrobacterium vitis]|uniref:Gfo/Idh/MocA family oxidoreductase n=1 Tax=Rhizobium/Agrobacterium group TaxID=227290 RepID=UPI0012E915D4|nr:MULTISPECIES: Gfo/Idh/MocA family oxidoreductase [Rhizobium/Agrobacterium group]MCF1494369.1 hypothetical protein [Allorhizobium ampelinum]MVA45875.1 hypothetical protein [Agrobacterium vitis]
MKAGIIGFGLSGRVFHMPLLHAAGIEVTSVAVRDPSKYSDNGEINFVTVQQLIEDPAIDLVVVASPNSQHCEHACEALGAGKHVVIEKPLALNPRDADTILAAADQAPGTACVFHSRRWDGDFLTLCDVLRDGLVGEWKVFESAWSMNKPVAQQRWKDQDALGGGLLADFMPHLLDQAICLFGLPDLAHLDRSTQRSGSLGADFLTIALHYGERRARLSVDCFAPLPRQRFRLAGTHGEYVVTGIDNQEEQLRQGIDATDAIFGEGDPRRVSEFTDYSGNRRHVQLARGQYSSFYRDLRIAVENGTPAAVSLHDAGRVIAIIDALNRNQVWTKAR